ncbi:ABC transporter ATP-binding protein [Kytococcus sedentarius]|uniref:ABC transporter ATP-binding protein n=1 Tax=Kytococcus sedentarius TaxID=1276 RepID=UPI0035BC40BC
MNDLTRPTVRLTGVTAAPEPGAPEVLRDLSLTLAPGTTTAVTGPNGAGKSTLCRVVAGLVTPSAGTVEAVGQQLRPGRPAQGVAMLFQSPRRSVSPRMTLRQAIAEPLELQRGRPGGDGASSGRRAPGRAAAVREAVDAMAETVGLTPDLLRRRPAAVSDGQLQRAALGRALIAEPTVLLADEVTAMLDPATTASVVAMLRERAEQGLTVLTISHDAELLAAWCSGPDDRVLPLAGLSAVR